MHIPSVRLLFLQSVSTGTFFWWPAPQNQMHDKWNEWRGNQKLQHRTSKRYPEIKVSMKESLAKKLCSSSEKRLSEINRSLHKTKKNCIQKLKKDIPPQKKNKTVRWNLKMTRNKNKCVVEKKKRRFPKQTNAPPKRKKEQHKNIWYTKKISCHSNNMLIQTIRIQNSIRMQHIKRRML